MSLDLFFEIEVKHGVASCFFLQKRTYSMLFTFRGSDIAKLDLD